MKNQKLRLLLCLILLAITILKPNFARSEKPIAMTEDLSSVFYMSPDFSDSSKFKKGEFLYNEQTPFPAVCMTESEYYHSRKQDAVASKCLGASFIEETKSNILWDVFKVSLGVVIGYSLSK